MTLKRLVSFIRNNWRIAIPVIGILLFAVLVFEFYLTEKLTNKKITKTGQNEQPAVYSTQISHERLRASMLEKTKLKFPEIVSKKIAFLPQVPPSVRDEVAVLIQQGAQNVKIEEVKYANDKGGFLVAFDLAKPLVDSYVEYIKVLRAGNWIFLMSIRSSNLFIIEAENNEFQARIEQKLIENNKSEVIIQFIEK